MRDLVEELCSDECAGRAPGTPGGKHARSLVKDALRDAGLDPDEQPIPKIGGANILAKIDGATDRYVLVAAHYDHLGKQGGKIYRGADDNAAAVAVLVEIARGLAASRPDGRGVIVAAFDAEEPPHFLTKTMGSEHFARSPIVPLERIDLMVCLELVGHALGEGQLPPSVRDSIFALGAERSLGTGERVDAIVEPGLVVRRADAEIIPPLSDYAPFWDRNRPFLLLTGGRSRRYHTPDDTPEHLDLARMGALARWLERFVRDACARDEAFTFQWQRSDVSTLDSFLAMTAPLAELSPQAAMGHAMAQKLRERVQKNGTLPRELAGELAMLVAALEAGLA